MKSKKLGTIIIFVVLIVATIGIVLASFVKKKDEVQVTGENIKNIEIEYSEEELDSSWDEESAVSISFNDDKVTSSNTNKASVDGGTVTIKSAGEYYLTGSCSDGQVIVEATSEDDVHIILDNLELNCKESAPIFIKQADKTIITLESGSTNTLTDSNNYELDEEEEPTAVIFSKDDLVINGEGTLNVTANYKHGIVSKDDLKIISGTINIESASDGIRGKDSVVIKNGTINITAGEDGIKSNNADSEDVGYIVIEEGNIVIDAVQDGIQAESNLQVKDGTIDITTGGGSANSSSSNQDWGEWNKESVQNFKNEYSNMNMQARNKENGFEGTRGKSENSENISSTTESQSSKGIKAGTNITIMDGTLKFNTSDDSIHSNGTVGIAGGNIEITSGDDGIHADDSLIIDGGNINIEKSYEGLEASQVTINNGDISVVASDDGINAAGGNDNSSMNGRPGQNNINSNSSSNKLVINGGYLYVDSRGDGLDANGSIEMTGGTVIVNGPTDNGNGALDYDGSFQITDGTLIAAGSSGMLQTISNNSSINCISITFDSSQQAGNLISLQDSNGNEVVTFAPSKTYQSVVICSSSDIKTGETYKVYSGGTSSKSEKNGLYNNGGYTNGNLVTELTVNSTVTSYGSAGMQGGGMQRGRGMTDENMPGMRDQMQSNGNMPGMNGEMPIDENMPNTNGKMPNMDGNMSSNGNIPNVDGQLPSNKNMKNNSNDA